MASAVWEALAALRRGSEYCRRTNVNVDHACDMIVRALRGDRFRSLIFNQWPEVTPYASQRPSEPLAAKLYDKICHARAQQDGVEAGGVAAPLRVPARPIPPNLFVRLKSQLVASMPLHNRWCLMIRSLPLSDAQWLEACKAANLLCSLENPGKPVFLGLLPRADRIQQQWAPSRILINAISQWIMFLISELRILCACRPRLRPELKAALKQVFVFHGSLLSQRYDESLFAKRLLRTIPDWGTEVDPCRIAREDIGNMIKVRPSMRKSEYLIRAREAIMHAQNNYTLMDIARFMDLAETTIRYYVQAYKRGILRADGQLVGQEAVEWNDEDLQDLLGHGKKRKRRERREGLERAKRIKLERDDNEGGTEQGRAPTVIDLTGDESTPSPARTLDPLVYSKEDWAAAWYHAHGIVVEDESSVSP